MLLQGLSLFLATYKLVGIGNSSANREPFGILPFNIQMESPGEGYVNPGKSPYVCRVMNPNAPGIRIKTRDVRGQRKLGFRIIGIGSDI
jgi:hypothetical protein